MADGALHVDFCFASAAGSLSPAAKRAPRFSRPRCPRPARLFFFRQLFQISREFLCSFGKM